MKFGKRKFIPISTMEKILGVIFVILLIFVAYLTYRTIQKKSENDSREYDQIITFMAAESNYNIDIDVSNMKYGDQKEFIFKVMNYNKDHIITEQLYYDLYFITTEQSFDLKLYKDEKDTDLLEDNQYLIVRNRTLLANRKQEDYYKLIIKAKENIKANSKITMQVFSEEVTESD